ncbi:LOW QUALITY PROTEIN: pro-neuregulin-3, membrane-bound isoform [Brachionichthys hirsutus]|uniref:LOW QUALITY PROTEIN: pro-neuregulin-3, membrane-bound isoform n=1 Tax=Brachionichthys hirsutus TaxID=412623 RepID=UPI0036053F71
MSHKGRQGKMSESSGAAVSGAVILEEPEGSGASGGPAEDQVQDRGPLRGAVWPRQQTWLCAVPLLIGFIGLGLSLMLLKWIVAGTVRDYVPTDLVDANRIGQDPIFLSKPSGIPKSPDTTTTTTTTPTVDGANPTRTATVAKGRARSTVSTTTTNPRGGGASGSQVTPRNPANRNGRGPLGFTTTTASPRPAFGNGTSPTVLHDSTPTWTAEHAATETAPTAVSTRTQSRRKTPSPSVPPLRSEHFKPCDERDLSYCLNAGECFVIETLSGPHQHCKCREGYQGIRCDQFLPKTDSILSDPNHLGIEFMESKDVYKRRVLSITSIAMAISLLGTLCVALYCRNKKRREKLQAHLKENRSLKNYTSNSHNALEVKMRSPHTNLQMHESCRRSSELRRGNVGASGFVHCNISTPASNGSRVPAKHHRSDSSSQVSHQGSRTAHWPAPRRTPPTVRGRLNPIGGSKYSDPAYQHLQEADSSEKEAEAQNGCQTRRRNDARRDAFLHMQAPVAMPTPWDDRTRSGSEHGEPNPTTHSLRQPGHGRYSPPAPHRSCSIPIIPSIQCHGDREAACMQTSVSPPTTATGDRKENQTPFTLSSSFCSSAIGRQQDEVALLLEEAQEQLRASARRKQEERGSSGSTSRLVGARESVCLLNLNGGSAGGVGCNGPTQTQLLSPSQSERPGPRRPMRGQPGTVFFVLDANGNAELKKDIIIDIQNTC